jgi:hypothetical protein
MRAFEEAIASFAIFNCNYCIICKPWAWFDCGAGRNIWNRWIEIPFESLSLSFFLEDSLSYEPGKHENWIPLSLSALMIVSTGSSLSWLTIVAILTHSPRTPVGGNSDIEEGIGNSLWIASTTSAAVTGGSVWAMSLSTRLIHLST